MSPPPTRAWAKELPKKPMPLNKAIGYVTIVVCLIGLGLCVFGLHTLTDKSRVLRAERAAAELATTSCSGFSVKTLLHDGHKYVVVGGRGIINHPDCEACD